MDRHFLRVEGEECVIDEPDGSMTIGSVDAVVEAVGGEEYVLEYDDQAASTPWLSTNPDGQVTVEVRSAMDGLPLPPAVYEDLSERPTAEADGTSDRVTYLATVLRTIWDAKGSIEPDDLTDLDAEQ